MRTIRRRSPASRPIHPTRFPPACARRAEQNLLLDARIGEPVTVFTGTGAAKSRATLLPPRSRPPDPKAKSGSKNAAAAGPAGEREHRPLTSLSPSSITDHAPSELSAKPAEGAEKPVHEAQGDQEGVDARPLEGAEGIGQVVGVRKEGREQVQIVARQDVGKV